MLNHAVESIMDDMIVDVVAAMNELEMPPLAICDQESPPPSSFTTLLDTPVHQTLQDRCAQSNLIYSVKLYLEGQNRM